MRWIGTAAIVVGLALSTVLAAGLGGASESASARAKFVKCGKYDLGFTEAKVKSRGMKCSAAKGVFNKWRRKVDCPAIRASGPGSRTSSAASGEATSRYGFGARIGRGTGR